MRIAIGGIHHETNCFAKYPTEMEIFAKRLSTGQEMLDQNRGTRTYAGGIIDEILSRNGEPVCIYDAPATPSGIIEKTAAQTMVTQMVELMWKAHCEKPLNAIALDLHGAGVAQEHPDLEGYVLECIRERFGFKIPVGMVLDLHGNITPKMIELSDIAVGVKCYPHVDQYEAAREMTGHLWDMAETGCKPCKKLIKLPWFIAPAAGVTLSGPAAKVRQLCIDLEQQDEDLLQATFFHGFFYADIKEAGVSVVTVAKTQEAADENALKIARFAWNMRKDFTPKTLNAEEAVAEALTHEGVVVINESSDNTGGGAPGDGTYLLSAMLESNVPGSVFGGIWDPEVVKQAVSAGVGNRISCLLGGKTDDLHGGPVELTDALVEAVCDGRYICKSPMGAGSVVNMGESVRLKAGNVTIIVVSARSQPKDDGILEMLGVDYRQQRLIALKSTQHFKAWWIEHCNAIVTADPPGIHSSDITCFDFKYASRDNYPLQDAKWSDTL